MTETSVPHQATSRARIDPQLFKITEENYQRLRTLILEKPTEFRFFTGAGISKPAPSNMPLASEFQHKCLAVLQEQKTPFATRIERLTKGDLSTRASTDALPLESLLQYLKDVDGADVISICDIYKSSPSEKLENGCHRFLAAFIAHKFGPVITVNIDTLIEDALSAISDQPNQFVYADMLHLPTEAVSGNLYKLHGTVNDKATLRMTLDRVMPRLPLQAEEFFRSFVGTGPLCFVGWAGADLDLRHILIEEARIKNAPRFYVIYPRNDCRTEEDFRKWNHLAFDIIDRIGAFVLYMTGEDLFQRLGEDIFGWQTPTGPIVSSLNRDFWAPLTTWIASRPSSAPRIEYLVGRLTGNVYFHLGLHLEAYNIWQEILPVAPNALARAHVLRDSAHALFREHKIGDSLKVNSAALAEAIKAKDESEQAYSLFGLGSIPTAWPASDMLSFVLAGTRLRDAAGRFERMRKKSESAARDIGAQKWIEAAIGEAPSLYWLARWEQRWLAPLIPFSKRIRDRLSKLYDRARILLVDPRVNAVNELVNPLRSMALVRVYDDRVEALAYANEAERLARWTGDRQRLATVLRDVAQTNMLAGSTHLSKAMACWKEALLVACEGIDLGLADPNQASPEALALSLIRVLSANTVFPHIPDANGISGCLAGIAETLSRMGGSINLEHAKEIVRKSPSVVLRLPLPRASRWLHAIRFLLLLPDIYLKHPSIRT